MQIVLHSNSDQVSKAHMQAGSLPVMGGYTLSLRSSVSPVLTFGAPAEDVERTLAALGLTAAVTASKNASGGYNYSITVAKYALSFEDISCTFYIASRMGFNSMCQAWLTSILLQTV